MCDCCPCDPCCCPPQSPQKQSTFERLTVVATPRSDYIITSSGEVVTLPPGLQPRPGGTVLIERAAPIGSSSAGKVVGAMGVTPSRPQTKYLPPDEVFPVLFESEGSPQRPFYLLSINLGSGSSPVAETRIASPLLDGAGGFDSEFLIGATPMVRLQEILTGVKSVVEEFTHVNRSSLEAYRYRAGGNSDTYESFSNPDFSLYVSNSAYTDYGLSGPETHFDTDPPPTDWAGELPGTSPVRYGLWAQRIGPITLRSQTTTTLYSDTFDTLELLTGNIISGTPSSATVQVLDFGWQATRIFYPYSSSGGVQVASSETMTHAVVEEIVGGVLYYKGVFGPGDSGLPAAAVTPWATTPLLSSRPNWADEPSPRKTWTSFLTGQTDSPTSFPPQSKPLFKSANTKGVLERVGMGGRFVLDGQPVLEGSNPEDLPQIAGIALEGGVIGLLLWNTAEAVYLHDLDGPDPLETRFTPMAFEEQFGFYPQNSLDSPGHWDWPFDRMALQAGGKLWRLAEFDAWRDVLKAGWRTAGFRKPLSRAKFGALPANQKPPEPLAALVVADKAFIPAGTAGIRLRELHSSPRAVLPAEVRVSEQLNVRALQALSKKVDLETYDPVWTDEADDRKNVTGTLQVRFVLPLESIGLLRRHTGLVLLGRYRGKWDDALKTWGDLTVTVNEVAQAVRPLGKVPFPPARAMGRRAVYPFAVPLSGVFENELLVEVTMRGHMSGLVLWAR